MFMTAPMGVMQQVQPPLAVAPSHTPQVAPAAQRLLASAIAGTTPAPFANPDRKQAQTGPQPKTPSLTPAPVSPESWVLSETPDAASAPMPMASRLPATLQPAPVRTPGDAGFAAQLLAQEDMAEIALPQAPNIADILKRLIDRRQGDSQPAAQKPRPQEPELVRFATPPANTLNTVMRRDTFGSVMVQRGAASYLQAQQRMNRPHASAALSEEELADAA